MNDQQRETARQALKIATTGYQCPECGRVFDMFNDTDAAEWYYGHDCE